MKKIIISLLLLAIVVGIAYRYLYKDHRNIGEETAAYTLDAPTLSAAFKDSPNDAQAKYLDKTLLVSGEITTLETTAVNMVGGVYGEFVVTPDQSLVTTQEITIKGRCIGYDELLEVVKLDQCILIN